MSDNPTHPDFSDDAKAILGSWFGMGMKIEVTLRMVEQRPTARTRKALDELVEKGALSRKPFNRYGGEVYLPMIETRHYGWWLSKNLGAGKWPLMEPMPQEPKAHPIPSYDRLGGNSA